MCMTFSFPIWTTFHKSNKHDLGLKRQFGIPMTCLFVPCLCFTSVNALILVSVVADPEPIPGELSVFMLQVLDQISMHRRAPCTNMFIHTYGQCTITYW